MQAFRRHWILGVFLILAVVWAITLGAYYFGADRVSFHNKFTGQDATIDFMRKYDRPVVELAENVGLELDKDAPALRGEIVKLESAPIGLCWVCGRNDLAGGIAMVEYRSGDWLYRAPFDDTSNGEALHGRPESRDYILTVAYNRATGERVIAGPDMPSQAAALAAHGLAVADRAHLSPATIVDLSPVSMMREGCMIFNLAFVAAAILWLVLGGSAALIVSWLRRRR